ncbi:MAG TPA: hypothetical protein VHB79_38170 [Polyangiaceae bacterium]|nr:hypothetical protein [Polyangiaceae bacterium]
MARFATRGVVCGYALLGCSALLSSCGDSSSGSNPAGGTGSGAEAGNGDDTSGSGGTTNHGGSGTAGKAMAGSSTGGSAQAGTTNNQGGEALGGSPTETGGEGPGPSGGGQPGGEAGAGNGDAGAGGDGGVPIPKVCTTDADGDGYGVGDGCAGPDCDDANPLINPGMLELADDDQDNDCQGGDIKASGGVGYYVDGSDPDCSDAQNATGSKDTPYCTIELAVVKAYQATTADDKVGRSIFVAQGTYPNTVGTPRSMRLYGGYDSADWSYDPVNNVTTIGGADVMQDLDGFKGVEMWLNVNGSASVAVQGFHITGGKRAGAPIKAIEINSAGKVELYDNVIVAGEGYQTLGVNIFGSDKNDPTTSNVWLIQNRISAGVPTDSSNYGLNNLGTAVLWGNVIDMAQGKSGSFGAAVQNYGTMTLVNNVLNGGDYGGGVDASYGFINSKADGLPNPGQAFAYHNVIFGGRGSASSVGVSNNASLTLVNNVLGDRTPGPLTFAQKPTSLALPLDVGFANSTYVSGNDLFNLIYSDEVSPPNVGANRHLFEYADNQAHPVDDLAVVNACLWTGCTEGGGANVALVPGFTADFHLADGSLLIGAGVLAGHAAANGLPNVDIDGQQRPIGTQDIGIDER